MSERDSTSDSAGGLNIVLTPDEKRLFGQLFQAADSENLGVVTGELAVKFFEKSGLNPRILGEIWGIADTENRGLLTKVGFSVALRLIGQAQAGLHPRPELALNPGHLPRFEGLNITPPAPQAPPTTASPPPPIAPQTTPGPPIVRVPQLTDADCKRFTELFQVSGAVNGILPGDIARGIFQRSRLPNQTLGLIWNLADRQQRGALGAAEFVVAMHLINCCKNGSLQALPSVLPPALYEAASGRPPMKTGPGPRGPGGRGGPSIPSIPPIPKQFSGPGVRAQSPLSRQFTPPNPMNPTISGTISSQTTGEWAVSPREKAEFDTLFASVDKGVKGFITGEEAVPFFSNSKLPEDVLAQIWDLADIHKAGRLSQDEFAVAMFLIRQQRSRRDGKGLPDALPPNLIPPSMRQQLGVNNALLPPSAQNVQSSSSAMDELFGLDAFTSPPPSTADVQGSMSAFNAFNSNDVFGVQQKPSSPPSANSRVSPPPVSSMFAPPQPRFVPQSNFGQTLMSATGTGGSTASMNRPAPSAMEDLLGDGDPEVSKKLTPDTAELANLSNQIGQLTMQTQELKNKRTSAEQELNTFTSQKHDIELRLSQIRSLYEREAKDVKSVEDRLSASRSETNRLRQEYSSLEASYNELQSQRQEVASQLEADQRENLDLKERMRLINAENLQLRQQLEKLKSDARQHKGLVAISKKQLATSEGERDRLKSEIDDLRSAAAHSQVASPTPGSPTPSQASISTNPFYRRSPPAAPESAFSPSPFAPNAPGPSQSSYDDVFGPSFGNSSSGPAPPISFGKQVQVNPPTSTHDGGFSSRPDTPNTHWTTQSVDSPSRERDPFQRSEDRRGSFSVKSDAGTESSAKIAGISALNEKRNEDNKSPFAPVTLERNITGTTSGGDEFKKPAEKRDSFSGFPTGLTSGIPGAFPPPIKPTATGESTRSKTSTMSKPEVTFASTVRSDPFSLNKDENRAPSASKEDMDAAFGSFVLPGLRHQERQNTGGSGMSSSKINIEFPPIEELKQDDDSDSDVGTTGFDDNFEPPPPTQARSTLPGSVPPTTSAPPPGSSPEFGSKPGTPLPPANAQQSPPTYNSVVSPIPGSSAEKGHFPADYRGLLPSRSDPMSHEANTPGGSTNAVLYGSISPASSPPPQSSMFGGPSSSMPTPSSHDNSFFPSAPSNKNKEAPIDDFKDFEDAFGDLEAAQEADGKDDFGVLAAPDSFAEFNPVFDSPDSKPNTSAASGKGSAQTDLEDEFTRFNFNIDTPALTQNHQHTGQSSASAPLHTASSQDWDAIFDGLEDQSSNQQTAVSEGKGQGNNVNGSSTSNDIGGPSNGSTLDITSKQSGTDPVSSGGKIGESDHEESLTKLTGMGFSRESSLKALEKFNFNVESATNHLLDG